MQTKNFRIALGIGLAALLLLPMASFGAEEPVAVSNYGNSLHFTPQVEAEDMILSVTGPCNYKIRRSLRDDGELVFKLDQTTIDGRYRFEVTVIPEIDRKIIDVLQSARKTGDNSEVDNLCREGALPGTPMVQASGFAVDRGEIVYDPDSSDEKLASSNPGADWDSPLGELSDIGLDKATAGLDKSALDKQIINGNAIVYNSICVGFDCPNSPSFGADTIRLQENNLRIHFDDTSTGSFPNQDWRIEANSNVNGGAEYLRFVDATANRPVFTVEANAPSNSLYVDNGGRVGNGTANPVTELHSANGDTPTLRLEQTTASGFAAQTWDLAGNETSFFIRDASNGSTLPFRIRPGASSNSLVIDSDSDIGIGVLSPEEELHILKSDADDVFIKIESSNVTTQNAGFSLENTAATWNFFNNNTGAFRINLAGTGTVFEGTSGGDVAVTNNLDVGGDLNVTGTKNFAVADPQVRGQWLYYSALEGPEAGTYYRGSAQIVDGEAVIDLPENFTKLTEVEGLTVQLTPIGGWHQLYVASKSTEQLVIRLDGEGEGVEFDYFVQGVRSGYADFQVERPAPH